jgi:hypothetical protein
MAGRRVLASAPTGIPTRDEMRRLKPFMVEGDVDAAREWLRGAAFLYLREQFGLSQGDATLEVLAIPWDRVGLIVDRAAPRATAAPATAAEPSADPGEEARG